MQLHPALDQGGVDLLVDTRHRRVAHHEQRRPVRGRHRPRLPALLTGISRCLCKNRQMADDTAARDATTPPGRGRSVALNSTVVAVVQLVILAIGLVLTPFIYNTLGDTLFGIWALLTGTVGFISVLDPGFGTIIIRYAPHGAPQGDPRLAARLTTLGVGVWVGFGLLVSPVLLVVIPLVVEHLHGAHGAHLSPSLHHEAAWFFAWGYAYLFASAASSIISCRLIAEGEQWISTLISLATQVLYTVVLIALLLGGFGLWGLAIASSVQTLLITLASLVAIRLRYGQAFASPRALGRARLQEIIRFGGLVQVSGILDALNYDTDPLVLGYFISAAAVSVYQLGYNASSKIAYVLGFPQQTLLQAFSSAHATESDVERLRIAARDASRLMGFIAFGLGGVLIASSPVVMVAWLGKPIARLDEVVVLLVVLQLVNFTRYTCGSVIIALGRVGVGARAKFLGLVANAICTLGLIVPFGITGVLVGTIIASAVQSAFLLRRYFPMLDTTARAQLWSWYPRIAIPGAAGVIAGRLVVGVLPTTAHEHRLPALVGTLLISAAFSVVYLLGTRLISYFSAEDVAYVGSILPGPLGKLASTRAARLLAAPR